ncbi:uncharacterized protein LOC142021530 isoform X2 [Carettochelys insculpta]|uniref:uncharacterized protein LOC142021530 isoform X2 n=1 Tax=Carettochelys insculpta TaxID=44489 RepID=UPI003EBECC8F
MGAGSADGGLLGGPSGLSGVAGGGRHDASTATFNPDDSMAPQLLVIFLTTSLTSATPKHPLRNAIQSIVSTAGATDCWMCTLLNSSTRLGIEFVPLNLNDWWDKSNIFWWGPVWFDDSNIHSYLRRGPWGSCCDRETHPGSPTIQRSCMDWWANWAGAQTGEELFDLLVLDQLYGLHLPDLRMWLLDQRLKYGDQPTLSKEKEVKHQSTPVT